MTADPCRKCGKKNHPTDRCHSKVTCKKCKGKDHGTRFCTVATTTAGYNCTFCRKGKHPIENCRAKRRAKRRTQMRATNLSLQVHQMHHEHQQDSPLLLQDPLYQQQPFRCHRYQSPYQICLYPHL